MIVLGLGSNLGNSHAYLEKAIEKIAAELLLNIKRSNIYESDPLLPEDAPDDWNMLYLNMAISGDLKNPELTPQEFLLQIKDIELKMGRKPSARWAPREIDIDILAWGDLLVTTEDLQIPHIALTERAFAIIPFAELMPDWVHPRTGIKAIDYAGQFTI